MQRPVFFNLTQIQLPVGAVTSITHRITGILLAVGIPFSSTSSIYRCKARSLTCGWLSCLIKRLSSSLRLYSFGHLHIIYLPACGTY